jgi:hypothetical protein
MSAARRSKPAPEKSPRFYRGEDIQAQIAAIEAALAALADGPFEPQPGRSANDIVAGTLTLLMQRGDHQLGWLVRRADGRRMLCKLPSDLDAGRFLGKPVVIHGFVVYADVGGPISISNVVSIEEQPPLPPLSSFIRTTPALPGELTFEEIIELMRGDD